MKVKYHINKLYINNPVNKNISIQPKKPKMQIDCLSDLNKIGISIITCTNRLNHINNILMNYNRQSILKKELILILNNNDFCIKKINNLTKHHENIKVFQLDENISLGDCLNYGVSMSNFNIIAKFDDDDYYSNNYLKNSINAFNYTDAQVIGKSTTYVYFEKSKHLAIRNLNKENRYVYRLEGPTLIIKKGVFEKVKFRNKNLGEDVQFCKDCIRNGIKLFSTDRSDYIYIRHNEGKGHTWGISDQYYKKLCKIIKKVENLQECISMIEK